MEGDKLAMHIRGQGSSNSAGPSVNMHMACKKLLAQAL